MAAKKTFFITGLTGAQGGATAHSLMRHKNISVHALVRDPTSDIARSFEQEGVVLFKGDFDDTAAIKQAVAGTSGVFLNTSPTLPDRSHEVQHAQNIVRAAVQAGVETVILSTAFMTGNPQKWDRSDLSDKPNTYLYYKHKEAIENMVRSAGLSSYTILRPSWLMHNYLPRGHSQYHFPELGPEGVLAHGYANSSIKIPHLDEADLGHFAAAALLEPERFHHHEIELGSENLYIGEVAEIMSRVAGVDVKTRLMSEEELKQSHVPTLGFHLLANVENVTIDGTTLQKRYGIALRGLDKYFQEHRNELVQSLPARI